MFFCLEITASSEVKSTYTSTDQEGVPRASGLPGVCWLRGAHIDQGFMVPGLPAGELVLPASERESARIPPG